MQQYKNIFIDLDRTLWDFETNARDTLKDIFDMHELSREKGVSFDKFLQTYQSVNHQLWEIYRQGKIIKSYLSVERFRKTLDLLGLDEGKASQIASAYLEWSPQKTKLFPGVIETLDYLKPAYSMYIVTNGFNEVQFKKIANSGLSSYFTKVITSDNAGHKKPDLDFFHYAFHETGVQAAETLMIGDDYEVDIEGAQRAGMDQVFVNYEKREIAGTAPTHEVQHFSELQKIL
ncbi:MAG: YjjG family noncanonical pyrimidine nucleotidase [Bacteroidota bacterium]